MRFCQLKFYFFFAPSLLFSSPKQQWRDRKSFFLFSEKRRYWQIFLFISSRFFVFNYEAKGAKRWRRKINRLSSSRRRNIVEFGGELCFLFGLLTNSLQHSTTTKPKTLKDYSIACRFLFASSWGYHVTHHTCRLNNLRLITSYIGAIGVVDVWWAKKELKIKLSPQWQPNWRFEIMNDFSVLLDPVA